MASTIFIRTNTYTVANINRKVPIEDLFRLNPSAFSIIQLLQFFARENCIFETILDLEK